MLEPIDYRLRRAETNTKDPEQLIGDITEAVWPDYNKTPAEEELLRIAQATPGQRALYVATLFARLVDNGGMRSFFTAAGYYSRALEDGLELLGVADMLEAYRDGLMILTGDGRVSPHEMERKALRYGLSTEKRKALHAIDERLYAGSGVEERLFPYFQKYVDAHPEEFFRD